MTNYIYALGFFDGVHLGHQALLRACRDIAEKQGAQSAALTFAAHPDGLVLGRAPMLINTPEDRAHLLERFGMTRVVTLPFDEAMCATPWEMFLEMLLEDYGASGFVCGGDFRFGSRGAGDAAALQRFCMERGLPCAVVPEQTMEGKRISSTCIRAFLEAGEMEKAVAFLGHPYVLRGTVVPGRQLGRTLGIPTANLSFPTGVVVPRFGVYACRAKTPEGWFPAVTNIGTRPTVDGIGITVEPWILDYSGDLYGKELTLEFHSFVRPEQKFPSLDAMRQEILRNAQQVRALLGEESIS